MALVDATTLDRIKLRYDVGGSSSKDALLAELITSVSGQIQDFLGKPLSQEARTELYEVKPRSYVTFLRAAPVASVASVKVRSELSVDFATVTATDADLYEVEAETGCLIFDKSAVLYEGPLRLQVTYTAGLAADTTALIAAYPQIAEAADVQVRELLRAYDAGTFRAGSLVTGQGQTIGRTSAFDLLPYVKSALGPLRRLVF